jgi:NAD(P)-dependent dehydrogenase (short-subunit alcohol dehydrogenase family)
MERQSFLGLAGLHVLLTGASGGIGLAVARLYANPHHTCFLLR